MTKSLLAIVFADSHLAETAWKGRQILGDSYFAFSRIVEMAIRERPELVIGAGDLIDVSRPSSTTVGVMMDALFKLRVAKIPFWFVQGQHDATEVPWCQLAGGFHMHRDGGTMGGLHFYGLDYLPPMQLAEELKAIPCDIDIFVGHQAWSGIEGESVARIAQAPAVSKLTHASRYNVERFVCDASLADVPHAKLLISGDWHVSRVVAATGASGQPISALSPGSTCRQSITETSLKFVWYLYDDLSLKPVPLPSRLHYDSPLLATDDAADQFLAAFPRTLAELSEAAEAAKLPPELLMPTVRVVCGGRLSKPTVRRISAEIEGRAHLFMSQPTVGVPDDERADAPALSEAASVRAAGLSGAVAVCAAGSSQQVLDDAQRLAAAADVQSVVGQVRERILTRKDDQE